LSISVKLEIDKRFRVDWFDRGRDPVVKPSPDYPDGKDVDASHGAPQTCTVNLICPAPRCGEYWVTCQLCGTHMGCTTAGRPDDPRSIKVACTI
jgi:hypothetical protein